MRTDRRLLDRILDGLSRPAVSLASIGVATLTITLSFAGLTIGRGWYDPQRAGTAAEWFSGSISSFAILFAWLSLILSRSVEDAERTRRDPVEHERRKAAQVFFWIIDVKALDGHVRAGWKIVFLNDTRVPIYDWSIILGGKTLISSKDGQPPLIPGETIVSLSSIHQDNPQDLSLEFLARNGDRMRRELRGRVFRLVDKEELEIRQEGSA